MPGGLAVAVDHVAGAEHLLRVEVVPVRQDRGHAGAQPVALDQRPVAHEHAGDVHERAELPTRKAADGIAELAQALTHGRAL